MIDKKMIDQQIQLCKEFNVDFYPTPDHLMVGVSDNVKSGIQPINGLRHPPKGVGSGWFIWAGEIFSEAEDFFKPYHYVHTPETFPPILKFFGLPPGWRFLVDDKGYQDVWFDEKLLQIVNKE